MGQQRLKFFGHMQRRDRGYTGQRMLNMELSGRRQRRRTEKIHGCNERGYGKGL